MQRHLNLTWATDGVLGDAKACRAVEEASIGAIRIALAVVGRPRLRGLAGVDGNGNIVEQLVLVYVVLRDVEAGSVGEIIHIEGVMQIELLVDGEILGQGCIGAALPPLPEDIALAAREVAFEWIAEGHAHVADRNERDREATGLERGT